MEQVDVYGNEIEDRIYNNSDYDYKIIIEDRIREVAEQITHYLSILTDAKQSFFVPMKTTLRECA